MDYVGNYGEGISRSCPKTHGIKSYDLNLGFYSVYLIKDIFTNQVSFVVNYCRF
jgi:hypothetical protein